MDENKKNRIVPTTSREVNINTDYMHWIADVKKHHLEVLTGQS